MSRTGLREAFDRGRRQAGAERPAAESADTADVIERALERAGEVFEVYRRGSRPAS